MVLGVREEKETKPCETPLSEQELLWLINLIKSNAQPVLASWTVAAMGRLVSGGE